MSKLGVFVFGFVFLFSSSVMGQEEVSLIRAIYEQTYKAAHAKFFYGMYAHRSADFQAYDADRIKVLPDKELQMSQRFLKSALEVTETGVINSHIVLPDGRVECDVFDTIEAVTYDGRIPLGKQKTIITTHSLDIWILTKHGWKLQESRLLDQKITVQPLNP